MKIFLQGNNGLKRSRKLAGFVACCFAAMSFAACNAADTGSSGKDGGGGGDFSKAPEANLAPMTNETDSIDSRKEELSDENVHVEPVAVNVMKTEMLAYVISVRDIC